MPTFNGPQRPRLLSPSLQCRSGADQAHGKPARHDPSAGHSPPGVDELLAQNRGNPTVIKRLYYQLSVALARLGAKQVYKGFVAQLCERHDRTLPSSTIVQ